MVYVIITGVAPTHGALWGSIQVHWLYGFENLHKTARVSASLYNWLGMIILFQVAALRLKAQKMKTKQVNLGWFGHQASITVEMLWEISQKGIYINASRSAPSSVDVKTWQHFKSAIIHFCFSGNKICLNISVSQDFVRQKPGVQMLDY